MASASPAAAATAEARAPQIRFTPSECERFFTEITHRADLCEAMFPPERTLAVTYESLVADRAGEMANIRGYLGLPERPVSTRLVKQSTRSLADSVENLEELRVHFERTRWSAFFRE